MPIEFNCHVCGKLLRTSDDKAGRTAKCPGCGESLTVPPLEGAAEDEFGGDEYGGGETAEGEFDDEFAPMPSAGGGTRPCPMCGEQIKLGARRCRFCGEDVGSKSSTRTSSHHKPHRGAMILTFSILGWLICFIFGIVAWVMANEDLREMAAGRMDPEGEGLTRAGKIIAIVQMALLAVVLLLWCVIFIIAALTGGL